MIFLLALRVKFSPESLLLSVPRTLAFTKHVKISRVPGTHIV